jgi:threonine/homoserine/homoserine lactone efflux protein
MTALASLANLSGWPLFAAVSMAHGFAVVSPGPDLAIVVRQTLAHGRAAGIRTALGIASGITVHVAYALFGLSFLLQRYAGLLPILQLFGAAILLWIGSRALRTGPSSMPNALAADANDARLPGHDYRIGLATNVFNVKAMLFFVGLCSAVVAGSTPPLIRLGLGAWMVVTTAAWFSTVAWTVGHARIRARLERYGYWIDRVMGAILVLLGFSLLIALI